MSHYNNPNIRSDIFNNNNNGKNKLLNDNENYLTDVEKFNLLNMYNEFQLIKNTVTIKPIFVITDHISNPNWIIFENIKIRLYSSGFYYAAVNSQINGVVITTSLGSSYLSSVSSNVTLTEKSVFITNDYRLIMDIYDEFNKIQYKITYTIGKIPVLFDIVTQKNIYNKIICIERIN